MKIRTILCLVFFVSCIANAAIVSNPIVPPLADLEVCDNDSDGIAIFDLSVQTPIILAAQSTPASDYNVTYHLTLTDANVGFNAIFANSFMNNSNQQTIYVRVENINTSEYSVGNFVLYVNATIIPVFAQIAPLCQGSTAPVLPTASANGIYGTWSPSTIDTTVLGTYTMTFTPDSNQCASVVTMAITVAPSSTLDLVSSVATIIQTVCVNSPISNIVYLFGGNATGATVTGLPASFSASISGSIVTISGTASISGFYPYTVTAIGGCYQSLNGAITVSNTAALTLISSPATTNQTLCYNQPITNIVYQFSGGATGASVTGLPPGVTSSVIGSTLIISGTSTVSWQYPFTVTTIGGCGIQSLTGSIIVNPQPFQNSTFDIHLYQCGSPQGIATFDLSGQPNTILSGQTGMTVSFYPSLIDATNDENSIANLTSYTNTVPFVQEIGIRITDTTTSCYKIITALLVAKPIPTIIGIGYSIVNNSGVQTLTVDTDGSSNYEYSLDAGVGQISPVFQNVSLGNHTITITNTLLGCSTIINNVDVNLTTTPPPTGSTSQSFGSGATLANIQVSGQNIQWYSGANKNASSTALPLNTVLVNGTTYYASQKIGGYESTTRLPVTVQVSLSNAEFELNGLTYMPNPTASDLNIKCNEIIDSVSVYNLLGQLVYNQKVMSSDFQVNLSELNAGNYFVKVSSETKNSIFKIIKN